MKKSKIILFAGLAVMVAMIVRSADIDGNWRAEFNTQIGVQKYVFSLHAEGDKITGQAMADVGGQKRKSELKEGQIKDDTVSFVELINFRGNELRIHYTGRVSTNEIAFTREVGDFAREEFKATRVDSATVITPGQNSTHFNQAGLPPEPRAAFGRPVVLGPDDKQVFPDPPPGFNQRQDVPHGKLEMIEYYSTTVGVKRTMQVYTPPGYSVDKKYPVLYLLHGIGGDETEWERFCTPDILLDNLLAEGRAVPMIIVMPNGRAQKDDRPVGNIYAAAPAFANFEGDLLHDVIPAIDARFSTLTNREDRALAGLSMGGGQSLNFGLAHLDTFAWVGGFSSAPNTEPPAELIPNPAAINGQLKLLWLSAGRKDGLISISQGVHAYLKTNHIPHIWNVDGNGHDATEWRNNLFWFLQKVFR